MHKLRFKHKNVSMKQKKKNRNLCKELNNFYATIWQFAKKEVK